jgi:hypothetical protein
MMTARDSNDHDDRDSNDHDDRDSNDQDSGDDDVDMQEIGSDEDDIEIEVMLEVMMAI